MINNSILCADAQVCNNLDVRVKYEYDRKRKMLEHENIIEQSGRSMIEMLGVLAIVGVLSVGGIAGYSKAMTKFKINKTAEQVSQIVANVRTLFAQQTSYSGFYTQDAIKMGVIPDSLTTSTWDITNTFNGRVTVMYSYGNNAHFLVRFESLPKEACVNLATQDWGSESSSGLIAMSIGGNYETGPQFSYKGNCSNLTDYQAMYALACSGDQSNPTPMSVAVAASACSQCEAYGCSISWVFK